MDIGEPAREITSDPIVVPVPRREPAPVKEPTKVPEKAPSVPEKVPA